MLPNSVHHIIYTTIGGIEVNLKVHTLVFHKQLTGKEQAYKDKSQICVKAQDRIF